MANESTVTMSGRFRLFPLGCTQNTGKAEYTLTPEPADTDFRKAFPPDAEIGSELDVAARVWRVYRSEAEPYDHAILQDWSERLDILLIFAGLFSAVATAFIIESYQFLQPDNTAYMARALYILVSASNHSAGMALPPPPSLEYRSSLSRWINGLWFTSILLSLAVAFICILAKQWMFEYRTFTHSSTRNPRDWARRHEIYFGPLNAWLAAVLVLLPILLHMSLLIFFAGVVGFLWDLDQAISIWAIVLGVLLGVFYLWCTLAPLWVTACPTITPLAMQLRASVLSLVLYILKACLLVLTITERLRTRRRPSSSRYWDIYVGLRLTMQRVVAMRRDMYGTRNLDRWSLGRLDASALSWLIRGVPNPDAVAVGLQALGALQWDAPTADCLRIYDLSNLLDERAFTWSTSRRSSTEILRVIRSILIMSQPAPSDYGYYSVDISPHHVDASPHIRALCTQLGGHCPDLALLHVDPQDIARNIPLWRGASSTLASTARYAFRAQYGSDPFFYLLFCDLDQFLDADWEFAFNLANPHFDVDSVKTFAKPLYLAVSLAPLPGNRTASYGNGAYVNELLRCLLQRVDAPVFRGSDDHTLLSMRALDLIASARFVSLHLDVEPLEKIALYFDFGLESAMRGATAPFVIQFWGAFACVLYGLFSHPSARHASIDILRVPPRICARALRILRRSADIRSVVLDAFLLPPRIATGVPISLWTILSTVAGDESSFRLEATDALAAYLDISTQNGRDAQRTSDWIDRFFAEVGSDALLTYARGSGGPGIELNTRRYDVLVHLFQHCARLRPDWATNLLSEVRESPSEDDVSSLLPIHEEASRRGFCQSCPEFLLQMQYEF